MPRISNLQPIQKIAPDDELAIYDKSASSTRKVKASELTGYPDLGLVAALEAWAYASWDTTYKTGVVTVPTGAADRYTVGMIVKITQATDKYFYIIAITDTTLTLKPLLPTETLANEPITDPMYSSTAQPYGAPVAIIRPADIVKFCATKTATQSVNSTGAQAVITWESKEEYRDTTFFDLANNRFRAPADGWLDIDATLCVDNGTGTDDTMNWGFYVNGSVKQVATDNWYYFSRNGVEYCTTMTGGFKVTKGQLIDLRYEGTQNATLCRILANSYLKGEFTPRYL